jgi:DNA-binding XRE family transcriptional regulator
MRMTQQLFAVHLEVDIRTVQRIEKGEHNMSVTIMFSLLSSLDLKPEDFFGNEEKTEIEDLS